MASTPEGVEWNHGNTVYGIGQGRMLSSAQTYTETNLGFYKNNDLSVYIVSGRVSLLSSLLFRSNSGKQSK